MRILGIVAEYNPFH
ncbi:MAG TPA: hypothetical protein DCL24_01010, partial [Erysipelotrichaceae bacterium]|nr:hypothetical protein [Erysipelotrichaceae bacterium]